MINESGNDVSARASEVVVMLFLVALIGNIRFSDHIRFFARILWSLIGRVYSGASAGLRGLTHRRKDEVRGQLRELEEKVCEGPETPGSTFEVEDEVDEDEDDEADDDDDDEDDLKYRVQKTDDFYCDYDSTWEVEATEDEMINQRRSRSKRYNHFDTFTRAARDLQNYRRGYKSGVLRSRWNPRELDPDEKPNLKFYCGEIPSSPDGVYIGQFHTDWPGQYDWLENVHSYIQWLFPLEEPGVNPEARTLTKTEIQDFLKSDVAKENLLKSYKLMLDFYGIKLLDEETGQVTRARNWRQRFENMNRHTHNNLRITRILKCLGTLGFPQYQAPLVQFFLEETLVNGELRHVKDSVLNYFLFTVLDRKRRRRLLKFAYLNHDHRQEFVWCPRRIQSIWAK